jgi:hypothetical protein
MVSLATAVPRKVDVRIPSGQAATLRPGPLSIVDGRPADRVVAVACQRRWRTTTVALPVDERTAQRLERSNRRRWTYRWRIAPPLLAVYTVELALAVLAAVRYDTRLLFWLDLVNLIGLPIVVFGVLWQSLGAPRQVPRRVRGWIVVRDVDPQAAAAWVAANPTAGMRLLSWG